MSRWQLVSVESLTVDEIPTEIISTIGSQDNTNTLSMFVFGPELTRITDEDNGTITSTWEAQALLVNRGQLLQNRLVRGLSAQQDDDSLGSVAADFGRAVTELIQQALGTEATNE